MRLFPDSRTFKIGLALTIGLIAFIANRALIPAISTTIQDASFCFTFAEITQGTNHTVYSGSKPLALLNRKLMSAGHRPIFDDRVYSWATMYPTTCLSVGFQHNGKVLKKNSGPRPVSPNESRLLRAFLMQQDGRAVELGLLSFGYSDFGSNRDEYKTTWVVPASLSNHLGFEFRLTDYKNETPVAQLSLR